MIFIYYILLIGANYVEIKIRMALKNPAAMLPGFRVEKLCSRFHAAQLAEQAAVSYTHLDVYKRQVSLSAYSPLYEYGFDTVSVGAFSPKALYR